MWLEKKRRKGAEEAPPHPAVAPHQFKGHARNGGGTRPAQHPPRPQQQRGGRNRHPPPPPQMEEMDVPLPQELPLG
eukprot:gene18920-16221_t